MKQAEQAGLATLQELSRQTGIGVSTLNYYTSLGFLEVVDRQGNLRLYAAAPSVRLIARVRRLRREGYPLRIIRSRLQGRGAAP